METDIARIERTIKQHIDAARPRVLSVLEKTPAARDDMVICRVRSTFPYKFVYLLGIACFLLREYSDEVLRLIWDNMGDEIVNDHPGLAIASTKSARVTPSWIEDEEHMEPVLAEVRKGIASSKGKMLVIAILATLENLSLDFIPDMTKRAERLGATDLKFFHEHGVADIRHAEELCRAAAVVFGMEKTFDEKALIEGIDLGARIIERMYEPAR